MANEVEFYVCVFWQNLMETWLLLNYVAYQKKSKS